MSFQVVFSFHLKQRISLTLILFRHSNSSQDDHSSLASLITQTLILQHRHGNFCTALKPITNKSIPLEITMYNDKIKILNGKSKVRNNNSKVELLKENPHGILMLKLGNIK